MGDGARTCAWTLFDQEDALNEGWGVFVTDSGQKQLQRYDGAAVFDDDFEAWEHVVRKADASEGLHHKALAYLQEKCPQEYRQIVLWVLHRKSVSEKLVPHMQEALRRIERQEKT